MDNDLEEIETELKEQEAEEEIGNHKISGHSVFEIERIIREKSELVNKNEKNKGLEG